jgi:hypothetical protein
VAIEYTIHDGMVWTLASGRLDDDALLGHVRKLMADPQHGPAVSELFDASAVTDFDVSAAAAREIASLMRHEPGAPAAKVAVIVNSTVAFGMARMYGLLRDDIEVAVFHEREPAIAWLTPAADR